MCPLTRRLSVTQGPPGTGKMTASVEILRQWSKLGNTDLLATAAIHMSSQPYAYMRSLQ